jgi:glycosyltransferase involved in cell wall biosynthesis
MKLALVTEFDLSQPAAFRGAFSGTFYHMVREFQRQGDEVELVGPVPTPLSARLVSKAIGAANKAGWFRPPAMALYHPLVLERRAQAVSEVLRGRQYDAILGQSSVLLAHYRGPLPIVYWRDANFQDLQNTYWGYTQIHPRSQRWAHAHERVAMSHAVLNAFSSECSVQTSLDYGIPAHKIAAIPYGANHEFEILPDDVRGFIAARPRDRLHLVFLGKDWERKGGRLAVDAARALNRGGITTQLDMIGCEFEIDAEAASFVRFHGFVDKHSPEGGRKLRQLLGGAHFMIHPAEGEAYGCALCEACSFGVPVIAADVGGVPTIVREGRNGFLLPRGAAASDYAARIGAAFADRTHYESLAHNAFDEYRSRLNWKTSVARCRQLLVQALGRPSAPAAKPAEGSNGT